MIVLANPLGRPIPLEPYAVMAAMYGDVTVQIGLNEDGAASEVNWIAQGNRRLPVTDPDTGASLGGHHGYVSAVAVLRERDRAFDEWSEAWFAEHGRGDSDPGPVTVCFLAAAQEVGVPHSDDVYLDVIETVSEEALPLPRDTFNGPFDRRWVPNDERTALVPLGA